MNTGKITLLLVATMLAVGIGNVSGNAKARAVVSVESIPETASAPVQPGKIVCEPYVPGNEERCPRHGEECPYAEDVADKASNKTCDLITASCTMQKQANPMAGGASSSGFTMPDLMKATAETPPYFEDTSLFSIDAFIDISINERPVPRPPEI